MLRYYTIVDDLAFRVNGSTVTLLGAVTRRSLKSDAENVAKHIENVAQLNNQTEVLPLSPMDDRIRLATFRAIHADPQIGTRYGNRALPSIHIIVKNGNVTREGMVANEGDKSLIYIRANGVEPSLAPESLKRGKKRSRIDLEDSACRWQRRPRLMSQQ